MNPPASAAGAQEAGKPEGGTFGVDAPMVPLALGATAVLLVIIGIVLMITNGLVAGLVAVIFGLFFGLCVFSYLYTTLYGSSSVVRPAGRCGLRATNAQLILAGSGAVLVSLAKRLTRAGSRYRPVA